jgi:hypothetical protein
VRISSFSSRSRAISAFAAASSARRALIIAADDSPVSGPLFVNTAYLGIYHSFPPSSAIFRAQSIHTANVFFVPIADALDAYVTTWRTSTSRRHASQIC